MHREQRMRDRENENRHPSRLPATGSPTRSPRGQVVMGPAFYVWDEDPSQAREWGCELANAWLARQP